MSRETFILTGELWSLLIEMKNYDDGRFMKNEVSPNVRKLVQWFIDEYAAPDGPTDTVYTKGDRMVLNTLRNKFILYRMENKNS